MNSNEVLTFSKKYFIFSLCYTVYFLIIEIKIRDCSKEQCVLRSNIYDQDYTKRETV